MDLSKTTDKPVLLSHTAGFSDAYVPINQLPYFPRPLTELYDPNAMSLTYTDLLCWCEELYNSYIVIADQAELVEKNTRLQAKSKAWFQQKAGHVTASKLKSIISTDVSHQWRHNQKQLLNMNRMVNQYSSYLTFLSSFDSVSSVTLVVDLKLSCYL